MGSNPLVDSLLHTLRIIAKYPNESQWAPSRAQSAIHEYERDSDPPPDGVVVPELTPLHGMILLHHVGCVGKYAASNPMHANSRETIQYHADLVRWGYMAEEAGAFGSTHVLTNAGMARANAMLSAAPPAVPAPQPEAAAEAHDEAENTCPNCVTPWKCNGPHESAPSEAVEPVAEVIANAEAAIVRVTSGHGDMRVPAEKSDPDLALRACIDALHRLSTPPPAMSRAGVTEPLPVFADGWIFEETGQRFSGKEMNEAAFAEYRDHALFHTPPIVSDADLAVLRAIADERRIEGTTNPGPLDRILAALTGGKP